MKVGDVFSIFFCYEKYIAFFFSTAVLHASVSASFVIEQEGLPAMTFEPSEGWNRDQPSRRLDVLRERHIQRVDTLTGH